MIKVSDELVMAYVDGALAAEQAAIVESALRVCGHARRLAFIFRATALCTREAFKPFDFGAVPPHLVRMFELEPSAAVPGSRLRSVIAGLTLAAATGFASALGLGAAFSSDTARSHVANINLGKQISSVRQRKSSSSPLKLQDDSGTPAAHSAAGSSS